MSPDLGYLVSGKLAVDPHDRTDLHRGMSGARASRSDVTGLRNDCDELMSPVILTTDLGSENTSPTSYFQASNRVSCTRLRQPDKNADVEEMALPPLVKVFNERGRPIVRNQTIDTQCGRLTGSETFCTLPLSTKTDSFNFGTTTS